ncbi:MAG TPA: hypothetical protein PKI41_04625 [Candidatus Competibacteraceae bacterium]|nr:MAG: hypothetical protein EKK71_07150 [Candidatus Competibacteraceae bacterium]HOB61388.1 hypothetical protein [Candidatus Competibacteraceae bacterium]HQA26190.1 hypothetical protein [Candidatus Competibacteraceae bacterium]HQD56690.1 hypothetical protein [Candidatus Competibacteraceae bacterium]
MASLNDVCEQLVKGVNDALGAAVVDLSSGLLLAVAHNVPYFTQSYLDAVAAAAVDMFRGNTVSTVEDMLNTQRGSDKSHMIKEVQMTTEKTYHFMSVVPGKENSLLVLITGKKANLGMGWAAVRGALPKVAPLCPF